MSRLSGAVLVILLVGGCALFPEKPVTDSQALWLKHRLLLNGIHSWNIKGRIAIKNNAGSGTLHVYWQQRDAVYELHLTAPLGQGSYLFKGSDAGVSMVGPDDLYLTATTAQELIRRNLGWNIDLEGLKYWIRGIPSPATNHQQLRLDDKGRLKSMEQSDFKISVTRYTELGAISLPKKLSIKNDDLQLKAVIQSWEFPEQI